MFDFAVAKINFVKLSLIKSEMNVKWFVFGYIHVKESWTINFSVEIMFALKR